MLFRHWRLSGHSINQIGNAEEVTWVRPTDNGIAHGDHCRDYDVLDNELHSGCQSLYLNIFDTVGTLVGLASKTGIMEEDGQIPHVKEAMMSDAIGTTVGSMMGSSTLTTYVESASGIAEGGRSGFTSLVTGVLFLLALFFAPLFLLIPSAATTGALVLVGVFMMDSITKVDMDDISEALPAFITMIMMVLTYSIADGMVLGLLCYVLVKLGCGKHKEVSPTMYVLAALFILKFIFA